ncbi:hypothetical protein FX988_04066 [Paraglaciecola mesophila]|uniref:Uncharacterized protein n=1 Tax=Paraglaciecola mesophila TaxID=197222 RepID=A0A857JQN3_9ALTE|nr:hypothetical protein [Paraglaciecola mesophila]QHJ13786.1 hypothetical protein FX988_04066 [Paraglaciecola mesophila]
MTLIIQLQNEVRLLYFILKAIAKCETPIVVAVIGPAECVGLIMLLHRDLVYERRSSAKIKAQMKCERVVWHNS